MPVPNKSRSAALSCVPVSQLKKLAELLKHNGIDVLKQVIEILEAPVFLVSEDGRISHGNAASRASFSKSGEAYLANWLEGGQPMSGVAKDVVQFTRDEKLKCPCGVGGSFLVISLSDWEVLGGIGIFQESERLEAPRKSSDEVYVEGERCELSEKEPRESHERFELAVEGSNVGIWDWDLKTNRFYWSPRFREFLGFPKASCTGSSSELIELIHPEDAERFHETIDLHLKEGKECHIEFRIRRLDGEFAWLLFRGQALWNREKSAYRMAGSAEMIDDRKTTEVRMEYLRHAMELSSDGFATVDPDGYFDFANDSLAKMYGHAKSSELLGRNWREMYSVLQLQRFDVEIVPELEKNGRWMGEIYAKRQDGNQSPQEVSLTRMQDEGIIFTCRDVSERIASEEQLRFAKEEAEELNEQLSLAIAKANQAALEAEMANQAKSEFLAAMSHEIRTPMNAVIGMTSILLDTNVNHEQREYLQTIRSSGDSLLVLINDILDFSKIESGHMELEESPLEVRSCIEEALDLLVSKASSKGLELLYEVDQKVPYSICGDVTRLRQILVNLVGNAIKFTSEGQVIIHVKEDASYEGEKKRLIFSVKDSGIGIPKDKQDKLFRSFSQVDSSTTRKYGGTGLGLAISKKLAELMEGEMWVESADGEGSTFLFSVLASASDVDSPSPETERAAAELLKGKRVVVAEGNGKVREVLKKFLNRSGIDAICCSTGEEALDAIIMEGPFDLVLVDNNLPDTEADAWARDLRGMDSLSNPPKTVLICPFGRRAKAELWDASMLKPFKPLALLKAFARALNLAPDEDDLAKARQKPKKKLGVRCPLRILMAEDNTVNQKVAGLMLKRHGYEADIANNGLEVLEALSRQDYDVILMDIQMPEMDGYEATREISSRMPGSSRPWIIALTANAMEGDREKVLAAGMDDYLSKPLKSDLLGESLEACFNQKSENVVGEE